MQRSTLFAAFAAGLLIAGGVYAQAPSAAPAGATGLCKDGSYSSGATKKGACRGHKGVQDWFAAGSAPAAVAKPQPMPQSMPMAPAAAAATSPPASAAPAPRYTPPAVAATGGGTGQVWANRSTKVYHCPNDRWYGKTKQGEYMSEAAAQAAGFHADHGRACH